MCGLTGGDWLPSAPAQERCCGTVKRTQVRQSAWKMSLKCCGTDLLEVPARQPTMATGTRGMSGVSMGGFGHRTSRCSALPTGPPMVRSASDRAHAMAKSNLEKSGEFASVTALLATVQAINQRV